MDITLKNAFDVDNFKYGNIKEHEIRPVTVKAIVDPVQQQLTGAHDDEVLCMIRRLAPCLN
jgi:hypothetical protein